MLAAAEGEVDSTISKLTRPQRLVLQLRPPLSHLQLPPSRLLCMLAKTLRTTTSRQTSPSTLLSTPFIARRPLLPLVLLLPPSAQMSTSTSAPAASTSKVHQPTWTPPVVELEEPVLKVWNSLTRSKVSSLSSRDKRSGRAHSFPFLSSPLYFSLLRSSSFPCDPDRSPGTTAVLPFTTLLIWVTPGESPSSRKRKRAQPPLLPSLLKLTLPLVYCRNYVTQDVLRRIMRDYFGYDVHFVQNITDIEDKVSSDELALCSPLSALSSSS